MINLRFFADMNLSPKTVADLRRQGWDIIRTSQILPMNASDSEILNRARQENRVIITQDLDFSALLALGGYIQPSLITLRLSVSDPDIVTQRLIAVLPQIEQALQTGSAVTVEDTTVRIRKLPIL
jgi:predicted nuclease of predicted toxin-antitoxin system